MSIPCRSAPWRLIGSRRRSRPSSSRRSNASKMRFVFYAAAAAQEIEQVKPAAVRICPEMTRDRDARGCGHSPATAASLVRGSLDERDHRVLTSAFGDRHYVDCIRMRDRRWRAGPISHGSQAAARRQSSDFRLGSYPLQAAVLAAIRSELPDTPRPAMDRGTRHR